MKAVLLFVRSINRLESPLWFIVRCVFMCVCVRAASIHFNSYSKYRIYKPHNFLEDQNDSFVVQFYSSDSNNLELTTTHIYKLLVFGVIVFFFFLHVTLAPNFLSVLDSRLSSVVEKKSVISLHWFCDRTKKQISREKTTHFSDNIQIGERTQIKSP